jgi:hypothetical protein
MLNEDYKDILQIFSKNRVRFLVVGAYAMAVYGYPRATGDFDIWVEASVENSERIYKSLLDFGAYVKDIDEKTFAEKEIIFQIGVIPRRIDIITHIDGVDFTAAYKTKQIILLENLEIPFLSKENLIKNKESTGRLKDKADADSLKNIGP